MTLHLVTAPAPEMTAAEVLDEELPCCKGCKSQMRPYGTTEAQYPGTSPSWGDNQCRICDYEACGKDPADRFIPVERVSYLASIRTGIETSRQRRGIPAAGSRAGRIPITDFIAQIS